MARDSHKYSLPIDNLPDAFAYHQVITDDDGKPVNYIFLEINPAFEEMTGLKREEIVGKKVTEILPGIKKGDFDWIGTYGQVALSGKPTRFENYSEPLGRWYEVSVYSNKTGFVASYFHDITKLKQTKRDFQFQKDQMKLLLEVSKNISSKKETTALAQSIVDGITKLTKLKSAAIYLLHNKKLYLKATYPPLPPDFPESLRIAELTDHPHIGRAISSKNPVVIEDIRNEVLTDEEKKVCELRQLRSILYVPITYQEEVIGVLIPSSVEKTHVFTGDEIKICQTLAGHAALSLAEAMLAEEKQNYIKEIEEKNESLILKEKAIRESEERLDLAMSVKNEGVWDWNLLTDEAFFDERYYTMAGYKPYEFPQNFTAWAERVHKEDLPRALKAIRDYLDGLSSKFDIEFRFMKKNGQWMWINGKGKIYERDASGKPVRMVGTHTDITDRKMAESKMFESQQTLDALMKYIPIGITIADSPDFRLTRVSRHGLELMGWPREKHEGLTVEEILSQWEVYNADGKTKADFKELPLTKAITKGEKVFSQEIVQIHEDGRAIPLSCDAGPIKDADGNITGGIVAWQDITEWKKIEKDLSESEQRAKKQRKAIVDLFLEDTITSGKIEPAVKKITEILSSTIKAERTSIWVIDEKYEQLQCLDLYQLSTGKHSNGDILHIKTFPSYFESLLKNSRISAANAQEDPRSKELKQGYLKSLDITALLDAGIFVEGKLKGVVSFEHVGNQRVWHADEEAFASAIASIVGQLFVEAERKKAQEEIRTLNKKLEQRVKERTVELEALNKELVSFAYSVSHDLRTPLRAIEGFSARLNEKYNDQLDEQGQHYLNRIRNNTSNMSKLIDDLLKLSRVSRTDINLQKVDLNYLAEEYFKLLQETDPARNVEIVIQTDLSALGDLALLRVMLENLLDNAWKFSSKEDQAKIEVGRVIRDGEKIFYIRDNGVGFDMTYADKIFGTFQRLHPADEFHGTGIGLATVQRIINRHGGKVWAESEVGKGATFYFSLPV